MNKYNLSQITKVLEKIFKAGFKTEERYFKYKTRRFNKNTRCKW